MAFLIDTCVWIDVEVGSLAPADVDRLTSNEAVFLSPVTIAELRFGAELAKDPGIRQKRLASLHRLQRKPILPIDGATGEVFGTLASSIRAAGRHHRHRVQDIWIASQAIQHGIKLLTRNPRDFADVPGLTVVSYSLA